MGVDVRRRRRGRCFVAVALGFWWNVVVYGLFFANCVSMANVLWNVVYTVYYLRCGEYYDHGERLLLFEGFRYTRLPPYDNLAAPATLPFLI